MDVSTPRRRSAIRSRRVLAFLVAAALVLQAPLFAAPPLLPPDTTVRVSVDSAGAQGDGHSWTPDISPDGRYVAFESRASNLVDKDTNAIDDIFVRDLVSGETTRVNVGVAGEQADGESRAPAISADGRYVAFASRATNLVPDDTNGTHDVFVGDLVSGETTRVSVGVTGEQGEGQSWRPAISADGRFVAFVSWASNLASGDTHGHADIFVRDLVSSETTRVSVGVGGAQANLDSTDAAISADGRYVAFQSNASNLVDHDTNAVDDVFVRDLVSGETTRVSVGVAGEQGNSSSREPFISADGRFVAFQSRATNLVPYDTNGREDIFVRDLASGETTRVSVDSAGAQAEGGHECWSPAISADGRYVAWASDAINLVDGDTNAVDDIFVRDLVSGVTTRVSVGVAGEQAVGGHSNSPAISADGSYIAFNSAATNLVVGDTNESHDVFVRRILAAAPLASIAIEGTTRFDTAVSVSEEAFPEGLAPEGARAVIIATGLNWPDALGGTSLAGVLDGPVLLVHKNSIPAAVLAEITRLGADKAIIIGGAGAVGPAVETALKTHLGAADVRRIGGADRYETANLVAAEVRRVQGTAWDGRAFVATGGTFQDAVAAAPLAAANGWPIYLAHPATGLSPVTVSAMQGVTHTIILGGTRAVSTATENGLVSRLGSANVVRLGGNNAFETAVAVANHAVGLGHTWDRVGITTGLNFPDALTGGVLQGKNRSVMLLTTPTTLHTAPAAALTANAAAIDTVTFFGGTGAVSQAVRTSVLQITMN